MDPQPEYVPAHQLDDNQLLDTIRRRLYNNLYEINLCW